MNKTKISKHYDEKYTSEISTLSALLKKYKCKEISELPVNEETRKLIFWFNELSIGELERLAIDSFNSGVLYVFANSCQHIFEKYF